VRYSKIINLSRPPSSRPKMSAVDRAAQFSAFAALVGLDEQMNETARLVDSKIELSEDEIETLNQKFQRLIEVSDGVKPQIKVTYFVPDPRKDGGTYVTKIGEVKRVDEIFHKINFKDGSEICVSDVLDFDMIGQGG